MTRIALFPGSFNPFTIGHADIVERALALYDKVVIAVGVNVDKAATASSEVEEIRRLYAQDKRVEVTCYSTLTIDEARRVGAQCIIRGVRSIKDYEYEREIAEVNRKLSGIETVLLFASPEYASLSSGMVRQLKAFGHDTSAFLPTKKP